MADQRNATNVEGSEIKSFAMNMLSRGYKADMFIGDIKFMNCHNVGANPSRKRLDYIKNVTDNHRAWSSSALRMSVYRSFKIPPSALASEGKLDILIDCAAIGFDKDTVSVVECCSEVVDRIAQNCRRMSGEGLSNPIGTRPSYSIKLGAHGFSVCQLMSAKDGFELKDMVSGPFGL